MLAAEAECQHGDRRVEDTGESGQPFGAGKIAFGLQGHAGVVKRLGMSGGECARARQECITRRAGQIERGGQCAHGVDMRSTPFTAFQLGEVFVVLLAAIMGNIGFGAGSEFKAVFASERSIVPNINLPFGISLLAVARPKT